MYHELSLIVWGILHQGADGTSSLVMPAQACAMAGIYGCGLQESALLNIKPDIAYRGVVERPFRPLLKQEKRHLKRGLGVHERLRPISQLHYTHI